MSDAEAVVVAQRERGRQAGLAWAAAQPVGQPVTRLQAIEESDRRYPASHPDFIAMHNLSGGFIDGATEDRQ